MGDMATSRRSRPPEAPPSPGPALPAVSAPPGELLPEVGRFADYLCGRGLSDATLKSYVGIVKRFMIWCQDERGQRSMQSVGRLEVAAYRRWLQDQGRKPATVNLALVALSGFFDWAVQEGIASSNPVRGVKRVPEQVPGPKWLDRESLQAFLEAVSRHGSARDRALMAVLLHAGLRVSEACYLRVADLRLRDGGGYLRIRRGKGGKYREVPLNASVRKSLQEYLAAHPGGEWLFVSRQGTRLSARSAERAVGRYARLAGLERVTAHTLRHTFCKLLVDAGVSLDRVAVLAGHANLSTTARYTRPSMADLERAVGKLTWVSD